MAVKGRPRGFNRRQALEQAMKVFWAKGFDGASLVELTEAMGINPPSLYAAFGSKEALFREATALYAETVGERIWQAVVAAPTGRDAVEAFLRLSVEVFTKPDCPSGCMIVTGAMHKSASNAAVYEELRRRRGGAAAILRERLERAVAQGELAPETDCKVIADFYATVQQGLSIQARDGASQSELAGIVELAMTAWEPMIRKGA